MTAANGRAPLDDLGGWAHVFSELAARRDLSSDVAEAVLTTILNGEANDAQIGALLLGLRQKGEAVEEIVAMRRAMFGASVPLELPDDAVDIVGVGGSASRRKSALNVSTMSSFVAAGAGATICKHGNYKASSTSGAFDLLGELGVKTDIAPADLERAVAEIGLGFALARTFHPAMRFAGPARAALGIPTVFNILGPMSHPGRVTRAVIGVADAALAPTMAEVLASAGADRVLVVTGHDAIDEFSITGPSSVLDVGPDGISAYSVDPRDLGIDSPAPGDLDGGDAAANAAIARALFDGEPVPCRPMIELNAGAGLLAAGMADDLAGGMALAAAAIDSGAAKQRLEALAAFGS